MEDEPAHKQWGLCRTAALAGALAAEPAQQFLLTQSESVNLKIDQKYTCG